LSVKFLTASVIRHITLLGTDVLSPH